MFNPILLPSFPNQVEFLHGNVFSKLQLLHLGEIAIRNPTRNAGPFGDSPNAFPTNLAPHENKNNKNNKQQHNNNNNNNNNIPYTPKV